MLGNYSCYSDFGNFSPHASDIPPTKKIEMISQINLLETTGESILCQDAMTGVENKEVEIEKIARHEEIRNSPPQIWMLYFDGSKSQEGSRD